MDVIQKELRDSEFKDYVAITDRGYNSITSGTCGRLPT